MAGAIVAAVAALRGATRQPLVELMASARPVGEAVAFVNDYVRVHHVVLEYPDAPRRVAEERPVVVYVRVTPEPGVVNPRLLLPPRGARSPWRPGVVPRAVRIERIAVPPPPPDLQHPGTDLPRDADEENQWDGGRLVRATFRPLRYGVGTGRFPSVTTFLSEGVIEVWHRGMRRQMAVQAGDAFWFEPATRITVIDDYPVGAAIVQLWSESEP